MLLNTCTLIRYMSAPPSVTQASHSKARKLPWTLLPRPCDHCLARAKSPAVPSCPPGNHLSPHTLSPDGPLGPWSVLSWPRGTGNAVDLLLLGGGCNRVGSILKGARELWQGEVGLMLSTSLADDTQLLLGKAGFIRTERGPVLETRASLPKLGVTSPTCISCRQTDR